MPTRPNVILVMTDDQGYGDLGCTGNPWIRTPHIDGFYRQCTRLPDFHVSPLCTPTRGALMSGHRPTRNGAWATTWGRSMLRSEEVTMAEVFRAGGYATGMFGKWHIGDNYPYRPQDRGFEHVVAHRGGGVGQTPDFWDNSYFDDTYFHNGQPRPHTGYCTDIWFDEAMKFIESNRERPFFCYLATNAPHAPYRVEDRYRELYEGNDQIPFPAFYGMITNIDENMGRLMDRIDQLGLADNTILIFMTDNGSSGGLHQGRGYNAGMRGTKGSYYDGGHRVPFFIRWPAGGLAAGHEVDEMVLHVDLLPTFIDLCSLSAPDGVVFDGMSVAPLLRGEAREMPDRIHFLQYRQSTLPPEKWTCAVMTRRWRLIGGEELYEIKADPGQQHDVAGKHGDVVSRLRDAHEKWWEEVSPQFDDYCPISIGAPEENPTRLDAFDLMGDVAWNQSHVRQALRVCGKWNVKVERGGRYRVSVQRWPREADLPIHAVPEVGEAVAVDAEKVQLKVGGFDHTVAVTPDARAVDFELDLQPGRTELQAWFIDGEGERYAAYYAYVKRL